MLDAFPVYSHTFFFLSFRISICIKQQMQATINLKLDFLHVVNWVGPGVTDKTSWKCKISKFSVSQHITISVLFPRHILTQWSWTMVQQQVHVIVLARLFLFWLSTYFIREGLEKQGLFLQVIPLPKCQTIKFLNTHFEDFLELFRGQMPLENENTNDIIKLVCAQEYFCPKFYNTPQNNPLGFAFKFQNCFWKRQHQHQMSSE